MRTSLLTQSQLNAVSKMLERGRPSIEIAQLFGVHPSSVRDFKRAYDRKLPLISTKHEQAEIKSHKVESMPVGELWDKAAAINKQKIQEAESIHNFDAKFTDNLPIAISFASDQHISVGNTVDMEQMKADAQLIAATDGMSVVCVGDAIDNHIKHRAAMVHARSTPGDQYKLLDYYLGLLQEKLLVLVSGNHDDWTNHFAGVDVLKMLADKNKVMHAPDEARISVAMNAYTYEIAARHQFRYNSSLNNTHSIKQWFRFGARPYDIGCLAHLHELAFEPFFAHGLERYSCRPGSYQITSSYSRQLGYNITRPSCPTFVLYPDRRDMVGFTGLRHAARFLGYERQRYADAERLSARLFSRAAIKSHVRRVSAKARAKKRGRK